MELKLNASQQMIDAIQLLQDVANNAPDLLLESIDGFFQCLQGSETITCDYDGLSAPGACARFGTLKFGDEFISCVSALRALYRQRDIVIPTTFNKTHIKPPVSDETINPNVELTSRPLLGGLG